MESIVPNLFVRRIEDSLPFYERLGFEMVMSLPHPPDVKGPAPVGFAILKHGAVELMLQSLDAVALDVPGLENDAYRVALYVRVPDLAPIRAALEGTPYVVPERTTFYGAREIIVRDPAGNVLSFASHT
jgi:catechol 2,3-dioxygenase-like lactoylglutathione lyase family enzyme